MDQQWIVNLSTQVQSKLNEALQGLLQRPVNLAIGACGVLTIDDVHKQLGDLSSEVTTVYIPIMGDVVGDIFMILPGGMSCSLADMMMGQDVGKTQLLGDFEMSAIKELGNICSGVVVTELANTLKLSMVLTVPNLATDMVGALVDQVLIEYGATGNDLLALDLGFTLEGLEGRGSCLILFDQASSDLIRSKVAVS